MVLAMASVIRWALVYWILAQVVFLCAALGDPVHIKLDLDGKDSIKDEKLAKLPGLVKMWYNAQNKPMYNDPVQKKRVESPGLKKLYIRGKFEIEGDNDRRVVWGNKRKAKELGEFILKMFKSDAVVIVVFPDDLQTYLGFEFQKEFEKEVQKTNGKITVGRGVINVYLGLGDQNQKDQVKDLLNNEINRQNRPDIKDFEKDEKYFSIFAAYISNKFSFKSVFSDWSPDPADFFRVQIQEADSVAVKLMAVCTSDKNGLKVGSQTEQGLADILLKLLRVQGVETYPKQWVVETHPKQRVRVELPKECVTKKEEREVFTDRLVNDLLQKDLKAFGKEPLVHMHVYDGGDPTFSTDIEYIKTSHKQDIFVEIKNGVIQTQVNHDDRVKVSSAKELFIHIHCHGHSFQNGGIVCGKDSETLAKVLSNFFEQFLEQRVPRNAIVKFHVCEAGKPEGQKYVIDFLTKFNASLHEYKINIQESLSYKSETSQINEHNVVTVPCETWDSVTWPGVNEKQVYGRFTVRTTKTAEGYEAFTVLPFTEYNILYSK